MEYNYLCPKCRSNLNLHHRIIFAVKNEKDERGLMLLDPRLGHYDSETHPGYHILEGEKVEFMCPICHVSLTASEINDNLVKLVMIENENKEHEVYFSRVKGEKSTYWFTPESFKPFGDDADKYLEFFKSSKKYSGLL